MEQIEMHTAEQVAPEISSFEVKSHYRDLP